MYPGYPLIFLLRKKLQTLADPGILVPERPVPRISIPKVILVLPIPLAYLEVEISLPGHSIRCYAISHHSKANAVAVYILEGVHQY